VDEIYLTHMFVLLAMMRAFKASGAGLAWIWAWYAGALALSIALGGALSKLYSEPANRSLRSVVSAAPTPGLR
jgi:peptidoglycan/LPS O-acetylase OafA/YrhL